MSTDIPERKKAEQELLDQKAKLSAFVSHAGADPGGLRDNQRTVHQG
jgi:hypothetical protein